MQMLPGGFGREKRRRGEGEKGRRGEGEKGLCSML
jgi:hypothetical protein